MKSSRLICIICLCVTLNIGLVFGADVHVRPQRAYLASVTDSAVIRQFIDQQSIPIENRIDSIEIIDAAGNGFGEHDLIILYPSKRTYSLMTIEEPLKSMMKDWYYNAEQLTSPDIASVQLFHAAREDSTGKGAFKGLLASILKGLELYYSGATIEGSFRRDENSSFLELWNYEPSALQFRELQTAGLLDTVQNYDLLQIVSSDTTEVADSTMYDVIYVYKTLHDTVYVPIEAVSDERTHAK